MLPLVFSLLVSGWGCSSDSKGQNARPRVVPVLVDRVVQKSVPLELSAIGNVQAFATVSIKSVVGGEVIGVHFAEGQEVKRGDLLFTIDPRPFEAAVRQAEANLARSLAQVRKAEADIVKDTAQAKNARVQEERYRSLVERQLVAKEQHDQFRTDAESLEAILLADRAAVENAGAAVQADRAAVENAKIQLGYCTIRSPMDGRTGNLLVHRGNIVKASDSLSLAVVNQIRPIYVTFALPEKNLPEIRRRMAAGKLRVEARVPNDYGPPEQGTLTFVDNAIDATTGTIQLKGTFSNEAQRLWPGQFVDATLTLATQSDAVVVSTKAIQAGQRGLYVFVVRQDLTVESRPVTVDRAINDETVVGKGLNPGETVVVDGQLQLVPGTKVVIKNTPSNGTGGKKPA